MARGLSGTGIQGHRYHGAGPRYYNDGFRGGVIPARKLDLPQRRCDPSTIAVS